VKAIEDGKIVDYLAVPSSNTLVGMEAINKKELRAFKDKLS